MMARCCLVSRQASGAWDARVESRGSEGQELEPRGVDRDRDYAAQKACARKHGSTRARENERTK